MLKSIAKNGTPKERDMALRAISVSDQIRGIRIAVGDLYTSPVKAGDKYRMTHDAKNEEELPGIIVRCEGDAECGDLAVNEAYGGLGETYDLYRKAYDRNSIDNEGLTLVATVHFDKNYPNAFWNGYQMVFGDGDGEIFGCFTRAIDVIAHELSHGIVEYTAGLRYNRQSGALNESFADVFGSLVKQRVLGQTAEDADWIVGAGLFMPGINGKGIRSMSDPGTAYDDPLLGKDPQPGHMRDYVDTREDNGGVHINSGIPNRAFCIAAREMGGYAWEKAGKIWYLTLANWVKPTTNFQQAANATYLVAGALFGDGSREQKAVTRGWSDVGIKVSGKETISKALQMTGLAAR